MASSDEENEELVYGLDDEDASSKRSGIASKGLSKVKKGGIDELFDNEEYDSDTWEDVTGKELRDESMPRFEKNPKIGRPATKKAEEKEAPLDELLDLLQQENDEDEANDSVASNRKLHLELLKEDDEDDDEASGKKKEESLEDLMMLMEEENNQDELPVGSKVADKTVEKPSERKTITIKRDKPVQSQAKTNDNTAADSATTTKPTATKSSITITKLPASSTKTAELKAAEDKIFTEKHTGMRISKSSYSSETEMNAMLACNYGKFYRLSELIRRATELKESTSEWFSIFILGGKSETKCSAKGNSYIIWNVYDLHNLERQQDISLFLFGSGYKSHWKASEFQVFALIKPEFMSNNAPNSGGGGGGGGGGSTYGPSSGNNKNGSKTGSSWNSFANKKVNNQIQKLTLSIKAESQMVCLGKIILFLN
jgi:hypothetical protein